jgi:hypothetical protein
VKIGQKEKVKMLPNLPQENLFPADRVNSLLSIYWDSKMQSPLKAGRVPTAGTVFALQPALSSQQAVGVLVSLKAILGYRPSKNVIRKGGYATKADFLTIMSAEIEKEFVKKQSPAGIPAQAKGAGVNAAVAV